MWACKLTVGAELGALLKRKAELHIQKYNAKNVFTKID
jgi:hypothetical protein